MVGRARGRWFAGLLLFVAGCGTTDPSPLPDPGEGPIPVLALVPGAQHLFHTTINATMDPGAKTGLKDITMEYHIDATWRVVSVEPEGEAILDCTVHRIRGHIAVASVGLRMEFDSDDPAFQEAIGKDNPMSKSLAPLVAGAGRTQRWVLRKGQSPTSRGVTASKDGVGTLLMFAWLDTLPPVPVREGLRGDGLPVHLGPFGDKDGYTASWEVGSWDPATGLAEMALRMTATNLKGEKGKQEGQGSLDVQAAEMEMRDQFDTRMGQYRTRRLHAKVGGQGDFFAMGKSASEDVSIVLDLAIDRVEAFAPATPAPR